MDSCETIRALTIRVRELEEELAEYARQGQAARGEAAVADRLGRCTRRWRLTPSEAGILLMLLDAAPRVVTARALLEGRVGRVADADDVGITLAAVYVSNLRAKLAARGLAPLIETQWRSGWFIPAARAAELKALIG